jgi:hypothetical protein
VYGTSARTLVGAIPDEGSGGRGEEEEWLSDTFPSVLAERERRRKGKKKKKKKEK